VPSDGRTASDRLAYLLATAGGIGYAPLVPGTFGSLPGVVLAWALLRWNGTAALLAGFVVLALAGVWAAHRTAARESREDPGIVVIDEVTGQMLTFAFLAPTIPALLLGFFTFRVFDILKPPPARQAESLPGGLGIMADDWFAGVYACLALHGLRWAVPAWFTVA
jgi:phosphatidylglycerophosphatase A